GFSFLDHERLLSVAHDPRLVSQCHTWYIFRAHNWIIFTCPSTYNLSGLILSNIMEKFVIGSFQKYGKARFL
ncbi:MAG: hypothetical protein WBM27_11710, partial [bacterium]